MSEHPIEGLMLTAMNSISEMIDVNTIIGEPIETLNNITIIPISKVGFGFAAGGSEFKPEAINEYNRKDKNSEEIQYKLPFGGGSGAGVSISPIAFLVIRQENVKLIPVAHNSALDKLLDFVPDLMEKVNEMLNKQMEEKKQEEKELCQTIEKKLKHTKEQPKQEGEGNTNVNVKVHPRKNKPTKYDFNFKEEPENYEPEEQEN